MGDLAAPRGDFEQAVGGAGHMGPKISRSFSSPPARMDIFVAAMLGDVDFVQAFLKAHPDPKKPKGPHGITLLGHAQIGVKGGVTEAQK